MTTRDPWDALGTHTPPELTDPTLELHWAVQYLASMGQTFAEPKDDDSHRAMVWNAELRAFVGAPMAGPYPFRTGLRPADLTLLLIDRTDAVLGALPLDGLHRQEGYDWLSAGVATYLGGAPPKIERPEYEMPEHPVSSGEARFGVDAAHAETLSALYAAASDVLNEVEADHPEASTVRCWPHHFDIATLLTLDDDSDDDSDDGETRSVGIGMAPMGGGHDGWYWYVTPYPCPDTDDLPELKSPGGWHTDGWTGAVLPGEDVIAAPASDRRALTVDFIGRALPAALSALGIER